MGMALQFRRRTHNALRPRPSRQARDSGFLARKGNFLNTRWPRRSERDAAC
jgi:hypothetical protein